MLQRNVNMGDEMLDSITKIVERKGCVVKEVVNELAAGLWFLTVSVDAPDYDTAMFMVNTIASSLPHSLHTARVEACYGAPAHGVTPSCTVKLRCRGVMR